MSCIMITYSDFPKKKITLESGRNYGVNTNAGAIIPFDSYFRRSACAALYIASGTDTGNIPSGPQNIIGMQIQLKGYARSSGSTSPPSGVFERDNQKIYLTTTDDTILPNDRVSPEEYMNLINKSSYAVEPLQEVYSGTVYTPGKNAGAGTLRDGDDPPESNPFHLWCGGARRSGYVTDTENPLLPIIDKTNTGLGMILFDKPFLYKSGNIVMFWEDQNGEYEFTMPVFRGGDISSFRGANAKSDQSWDRLIMRRDSLVPNVKFFVDNGVGSTSETKIEEPLPSKPIEQPIEKGEEPIELERR